MNKRGDMPQTHPYTALVDAIYAELRWYYPPQWARERANNLAKLRALATEALECAEQSEAA